MARSAWPIGPVADGFRVAVEELLNTSRWLNAVGSTGIMRRAYLEASSFARHRCAFGRVVGSFPVVREHLAVMKAEEQAALASTVAVTALRAGLDDADADAEHAGADAEHAGADAEHAGADGAAVFRFLVNANKYLTSMSATDVARRGIEVLGGNGTIEDFSPLPRLYRDAMVFESWEGTHNVLCAQVHRDCVRFGLLDEVLPWIRAELSSAGEGQAPTAAPWPASWRPSNRACGARSPTASTRPRTSVVSSTG